VSGECGPLVDKRRKSHRRFVPDTKQAGSPVFRRKKVAISIFHSTSRRKRHQILVEFFRYNSFLSHETVGSALGVSEVRESYLRSRRPLQSHPTADRERWRPSWHQKPSFQPSFERKTMMFIRNAFVVLLGARQIWVRAH
jgi:hypothetical protein